MAQRRSKLFERILRMFAVSASKRGLRHDGLITNLTLETKGFKELPTDWSGLTDQILSMNRGVSNPTKSCWVLVNGQCNVRGAMPTLAAARLPWVILFWVSSLIIQQSQRTLGFPTLNIERYITQLTPNSVRGAKRVA